MALKETPKITNVSTTFWYNTFVVLSMFRTVQPNCGYIVVPQMLPYIFSTYPPTPNIGVRLYAVNPKVLVLIVQYSKYQFTSLINIIAHN